jgi:chaperonin cofactor prefoldin
VAVHRHNINKLIARVDDQAERALAELAEIQAQEQRAVEKMNRIKRRIDAVLRKQKSSDS